MPWFEKSFVSPLYRFQISRFLLRHLMVIMARWTHRTFILQLRAIIAQWIRLTSSRPAAVRNILFQWSRFSSGSLFHLLGQVFSIRTYYKTHDFSVLALLFPFAKTVKIFTGALQISQCHVFLSLPWSLYPFCSLWYSNAPRILSTMIFPTIHTCLVGEDDFHEIKET
jgi:hypothetical protein